MQKKCLFMLTRWVNSWLFQTKIKISNLKGKNKGSFDPLTLILSPAYRQAGAMGLHYSWDCHACVP